MKNFRTLNLAMELYRKGKEEKFQKRHLQDQYDRALLSIVLNLSEGSAKPTKKDRAKYYRIALGSLREVQTLLMITGKQKLYIETDQLGANLYRLCQSLN